MKNILVTGANGFIAQNLIIKLEGAPLYINKFGRKHNSEELNSMVNHADFIFHLAGEVKPNSTREQFENSNSELTRSLIAAIKKTHRKIPVLLASSIHSDLSNNFYGRTKKESELLIENFSIQEKVDCFIFKIPHVFGQGCKPNHNSVITTWIYNKVNNLETIVYDRSFEMTYVYVQDLVDDFLQCLEIQGHKDNTIYRKCNTTYKTTLGEVYDYIDEFNENYKNQNYEIKGNDFKLKLFKVFQQYKKDKYEL